MILLLYFITYYRDGSRGGPLFDDDQGIFSQSPPIPDQEGHNNRWTVPQRYLSQEPQLNQSSIVCKIGGHVRIQVQLDVNLLNFQRTKTRIPCFNRQLCQGLQCCR